MTVGRMMVAVGEMTMPVNFKYRNVFLKGKPGHGKTDAFSLRHPAMTPGHRAKIFAPFDALRGFGDALAGQETPQQQ